MKMKNFLKAAFLGAVVTLLMPVSVFADETEAIKKTVIAYNYGIIQMAKSSTVKHMTNFISEKRAMKLHIWIKSWHDSNLFMDASLQKLAFTDVNISEDHAKVLADEEWFYRYIDITVKMVTHPATRITYKTEYELVKREHGWIVDNVKVLSETQEKLTADTLNTNR